jgi:hypothetical protein
MFVDRIEVEDLNVWRLVGCFGKRVVDCVLLLILALWMGVVNPGQFEAIWVAAVRLARDEF